MSSDVQPMASVLMPSLNQARYIGSAVDSVLEQSYSHIELIVADGGSDDATLDVLRERRARDPRLRWFSAPDGGPPDALNKAMAQVRGTVVGWLNSDDLYAPGAIERAVTALESHREWAAVYGHGQHIDETGELLGDYPTLPPSVATSRFLEGCFICQPTLFFRRSTYVLLGPFDAGLKTAFDFEYWLRLFTRMPGRVGFLDAVQAQSRLHGGAITLRMRRAVALEGLAVLRRHLGRAPVHWALTHIGEILEGAEREDASARQREEIASFLEQAAAFVTPAHHADLVARWGTPSDAGAGVVAGTPSALL